MHDEITLVEIARIVRRKWIIITGISLLCSLCVGVGLKVQPRTYHSYSIVKVGVIGAKPLETVAETQVVMGVDSVCIDVLKKAGIPPTVQNIWRLRNSVEYDSFDSVTRITAKADTAAEAYAVVSALTEILLSRQERAYIEERNMMYESFNALRKGMNNAPFLATMSDAISFMKPTVLAVPPQMLRDPLPSKTKVTMVLLFFGSMFAVTLFFLMVEGLRNKQ